MDFDPAEHPHRRYNPLTGEHVLVSPHRTKRPWQGQIEPPQSSILPEYDPKCYLCPGNTRSGGQANPKYEETHVFTNDFAALLLDPEVKTPDAPHPLLQSHPVRGQCDVIIFHPRHDLTLARLPAPDIVKVIGTWTDIYKSRSQSKDIGYVQIFENKGAMMGCSNPHPHCQVWSQSVVPSIPATELAHMKEYADSEHPSSEAPRSESGRPNLLLEYIHFELKVEGKEGRVVVRNEDWVAVVPWWAVWPFEVLLLPYKRHIPSLAHLQESEIASFADILSKITVRYDNLFSTSFAYSMGIHQLPTLAATAEYADIQLHLHFTPPLLRSANVRKFLVGYELMAETQRDLTPEQAAARLRDCASVHYLS